MAQRYNFQDRIKGDTFRGADFTINVNGTPLDLSAASIAMEFRAGNATGQVVKRLDDGSGISFGVETGTFSVDPFNIDWQAGIYHYDIEITISGVITTYVQGTMKILQDVTQNV